MVRVQIRRDHPFDLHEPLPAEIRLTVSHGEEGAGERRRPRKTWRRVIGVTTNTVPGALCSPQMKVCSSWGAVAA
jgi:hypothetical protein